MLTLISWLVGRLQSRAELELEVIVLRHQLAVLRSQPDRLWLRSFDRLLWVWLYRGWPRRLDLMVLVKPGTVIEWHRRGFRLDWRWRSKAGRPAIDTEVRQLMGSTAHPRRVVEARNRGESSDGGQVYGAMTGSSVADLASFLRNQVDGIAAIDMFRVA